MPVTYDRELALEVLTQIYDAIQKIKKRFDPVNSAEQFTNSDEGMEKLDSRSGSKTPDQVQGQGAGRSRKRSIRLVCEHLSEVCNAAIGPRMGF